MPLLVLVAISLVGAGLVMLIGLRYPLSPMGGQPLSVGAGIAVGEELRRHARLRALLRQRFDPSVASGLALALAAIAVISGGLLLGVLAYLVRGQSGIVHLDRSVAQWAYDHRGLVSTDGLRRRNQAWRDLYGRRLGGRACLRGDPSSAQPVDPAICHRRDRRRQVDHTCGQGPCCARPPDPRTSSAGARRIVSERPYLNGSRLLRLRRASSRAPAREAHKGGACRRSRGNRARGCLQPCLPRPPLALRCHRWPSSRLGLVCRLQHCLRRPASATSEHQRKSQPGSAGSHHRQPNRLHLSDAKGISCVSDHHGACRTTPSERIAT